MFISDGLGGDVNEVRWIGLSKARDLFEKERAIFIDCRSDHIFASGSIPGARNVSMERVGNWGIVDALGRELIHEMLSTRRHQLIIVTSQVATPYSRCRAFCRYLLRAGHTTLPAARFRRLRGGIFGWKHKGGPVTQMLAYHGDEPYPAPPPPPLEVASRLDGLLDATGALLLPPAPPPSDLIDLRSPTTPAVMREVAKIREATPGLTVRQVHRRLVAQGGELLDPAVASASRSKVKKAASKVTKSALRLRHELGTENDTALAEGVAEC
mmetsp:Transcript_4270/g.14142  ORF Transcript_4270/g.14142 Transcript_4270/m.14142 type:complete len:269 (+) Transcript_4270:778-1584(+)